MIRFGTIEGDLAEVQDVAVHLAPAETNYTKFAEKLDYINGGTAIRKSADSHKSYTLSYSGSMFKSADVDVIMDYYHGEYGQGLIYFADPLLFGRNHNVFRRNWATPALIQDGYKSIYHTEPTFTGATLTPTATYTLDASSGRYFTIIVPNNHVLWLGGKYSSTGNATIKVYKDGIVVGDLTKSAIDSNVLLTDTVTGPGVVRIRIEGDTDDTITIQSLDAQILPTGTTGEATGKHVRGQGVSGMRFSSDSVPYEYIHGPTQTRHFSVELTEVEEWL